ncbi:MAG: UDP-N-acetylmuramate--L-alanine ligase, partial [Clostridia bacterium]|nr:UDP-N-acetylmuramate--L-alanine ligase [Clostridia bacterium]
TLENVIRSFNTFASKATGHIIYNAADANTVKAVSGLTNAPLISYGFEETCDWYAKNIRYEHGAYAAYDLYRDGALFAHIDLGVPGEHNVQNSMAAAASAYLCGASAQQIADGLAHFTGAGRRFEFLGTFGGVTFVDDYAHHPTEIVATLGAAKKLPYRHVWAVFQPFTYTRTERHLKEFAEALSLADTAIVTDILGSREVNTSGMHSKQITDLMENGVYIPDFPAVTDYIAAHAQEGDLVLTMGGGDIYKCARMMAKRLGE